MNNDLEQFSEERLKQVEASGLWSRLSHAESQALARIALAAKQAKPVGYIAEVSGNRVGVLRGLPMPEIGSFIYTTPQPAHTEQDRWIKCSERMPVDARDVTVLSKEHGVVNGYYWSGLHWGKDVEPSWFISCGTHEGKADDITHWMPLPAAPKPESE